MVEDVEEEDENELQQNVILEKEDDLSDVDLELMKESIRLECMI